MVHAILWCILITAICCAKSVIVKLTVLYPDSADSMLPWLMLRVQEYRHGHCYRIGSLSIV